LLNFSPLAVERGCARWAREESSWPSVAKLRAMVEEEQSLINSSEQARREAIPGPSGEPWPARVSRLLGQDVTSIGAGHITAVMSLKADASRMTDQEVARELRFILEHGYRWRPTPEPIDDKARARLTATMMAMRKTPGLYGGAAAVDAMCAMAESMVQGQGGSAAA
jgi:hypothetical protein